MSKEYLNILESNSTIEEIRQEHERLFLLHISNESDTNLYLQLLEVGKLLSKKINESAPLLSNADYEYARIEYEK